jgi:hypothetical protein
MRQRRLAWSCILLLFFCATATINLPHAMASGKELEPATTSLLPAADANDVCLWVAGRACSTPRSCYDCLNTAPAKGQCGVDPMGRCVRLDTTATNGRQPFLPSTVTSYCDASDATCAACRKRTDATGGYYVSNGTSTLKPFCVGANGCVCVAACEAPTWSVNVLAVCPPSLEATRVQQSTMYAVFLIIACVLCTFVYFFSIGWRKPHSPSGTFYRAIPSLVPRTDCVGCGQISARATLRHGRDGGPRDVDSLLRGGFPCGKSSSTRRPVNLLLPPLLSTSRLAITNEMPYPPQRMRPETFIYNVYLSNMLYSSPTFLSFTLWIYRRCSWYSGSVAGSSSS